MSTSRQVEFESVQRIPMFAGLDNDTYSQIAVTSQDVSIAKDEILFLQGDPSAGFYFVSKGQMALSVSGPDGTSKVVEVVGPGETFGEAVVFAGRPYPVTASAARASELIFIPSTTVSLLIDTNPTVTRMILANMSIRLHQLVSDVESYTLNSATSRVVKYLIGRVPGDALGRTATITLGTSKQVVASRLNLTPATFSRSLRRLIEAEVIRVNGRVITIVDPVALGDDPRWLS